MENEEQLWRRLCRSLRARHFLLLATIQRYRILRRVASELGLSQAAVTKALQELEELFGARLFTRSGAGVEPTRLGEFLIERSEAYLQDFRRLSQDVVAQGKGYGGLLRVGITAFSSPLRLTRAISVLRQKQARYRFVLRDGSTDTLIEGLLKKEIDCVIGRVSADAHSELVQEHLYNTRPVLVTGIRHPVDGDPKRLRDLHLCDWILPPSSTPMRQAFSEMLVRRKVDLPEAVLETIAVPVIAEMLKAKQPAGALISDELAVRLAADKVARQLPLPTPLHIPPTALIMRRGSETQTPPREFLKALRAGRNTG